MVLDLEEASKRADKTARAICTRIIWNSKHGFAQVGQKQQWLWILKKLVLGG